MCRANIRPLVGPVLLVCFAVSAFAAEPLIEERIDWQLTHGMVEETRLLLDERYGRELGSMKGLGYRQVGAYLANECD